MTGVTAFGWRMLCCLVCVDTTDFLCDVCNKLLPFQLASYILQRYIVSRFTFANGLLRTPPMTATFMLAYCTSMMQTPPFTTWLVHPFMLHRLRFFLEPCATQTPPCWTLLVHPLWLHRLYFTFAPCVKQTPTLTTWLVHPSMLHRFLVAPWVIPKLLPEKICWYTPCGYIVSSLRHESHTLLPFGQSWNIPCGCIV